MAKAKYRVTQAGAKRIADSILQHWKEDPLGVLTYAPVIQAMRAEGIINAGNHVDDLLDVLFQSPEHQGVAKAIAKACAVKAHRLTRNHVAFTEMLFPFVEEIVGDLTESIVEDVRDSLKKGDA